MADRPLPDEEPICDECGTDHDGYPLDTFGGRLRCVRAQAVRLGVVEVVASCDSLAETVRRHQVEMLRRHFDA